MKNQKILIKIKTFLKIYEKEKRIGKKKELNNRFKKSLNKFNKCLNNNDNNKLDELIKRIKEDENKN